MANKCYRQSEEYKNQIRERDHYTCQLCGDYGREIDHIVPFAVSHDSSPDNLRTLCKPCNLATRRQPKNAAMPVDDWFEYLKGELT